MLSNSVLSWKACTAAFLLCTISLTSARVSSEDFTNEGSSSKRYTDKPIVTLPKCDPDYTRNGAPLLTLDAGGLRGIITVEVLTEVENAIKDIIIKQRKKFGSEVAKFTSANEFEIDLADYFEAIAGVESGSWIATYLASRGGNGASAKVFNDKLVLKEYGRIRPGSVEGLRVFFLHFAKRIYPAFTIPISVVPRRYGVEIKIAGVNCPTFPVRGLEATLDMFLGESTMLDTKSSVTGKGTTLLVHVYDLLQKAAVLFVADHFDKTHCKDSPKPADIEMYTYTLLAEGKLSRAEGIGSKYDTSVQIVTGKEFFMKDIARASSASPWIFEAKRFKAINDDSFELYAISGALMASNPTILASYFIQGPCRIHRPRFLTVLSVGSGISTGRYRDLGDAGAAGWVLKSNDFLAILMDGGSEFVQANFFILFNDNVNRFSGTEPGGAPPYLRVQVIFDRRTEQGQALGQMYDSNNVDVLQEVGFQTVARFKELIYQHAENFLVTDCKPKATSSGHKPVPVPSVAPPSTSPPKPSETAAPPKPSETAAPPKPSETAAPPKPSETAAPPKPSETAAPSPTVQPPSTMTTQGMENGALAI